MTIRARLGRMERDHPAPPPTEDELIRATVAGALDDEPGVRAAIAIILQDATDDTGPAEESYADR